jgi:hypothetical protein
VLILPALQEVVMVRVVYNPPAPSAPTAPGPIPLSHHEILGLVGPFSRRGRHVDLPASDRAQRSLTFKPLTHAGLPAEGGSLTEVLVLENPEAGHFRLLRTLTDPDGRQATLEIQGSDAGLLLEQVEAVEPARQFPVRGGVPIARSYRIEPRAAGEDDDPAPRWRVVLLRAEAEIDGVLVSVNAKTGRGMPAELELRATHERDLNAPQDLLAVLGWDWRPLRQIGKAWRGSIRLPKHEPARTAEAETKINRTVEHLARTFSRPPADFHARWQSARWQVTLRRAMPLLTGLAILAATPLIKVFSLENESLVRMLIFHAPPMMLVGMFMLKEMPVIEVPPLPRPLIKRSWINGKDAPAVPAAEVQSAEA